MNPSQDNTQRYFWLKFPIHLKTKSHALLACLRTDIVRYEFDGGERVLAIKNIARSKFEHRPAVEVYYPARDMQGWLWLDELVVPSPLEMLADVCEDDLTLDAGESVSSLNGA